MPLTHGYKQTRLQPCERRKLIYYARSLFTGELARMLRPFAVQRGFDVPLDDLYIRRCLDSPLKNRTCSHFVHRLRDYSLAIDCSIAI